MCEQLTSGTRGGRARTADGKIGHTTADTAWERLLLLRSHFERLDLLELLELIITICGGERGPRSQAEIDGLKAGCAGITAYLRHGRSPRVRRHATS